MKRDPVYMLDVCTLAYQLHSQSLMFPLDPYYEQMQLRKPGRIGIRRKNFMHEVSTWADSTGTFIGLSSHAGPASLYAAGRGWTPATHLDPILHRYDNISPHVPGFVRPTREEDGWIVYDTPSDITQRIGQLFIARYDFNAGPDAAAPTVTVMPQGSLRNAPQRPGGDRLFCFEGGTGATQRAQGANWSLMGTVLQRKNPGQNAPYDVIIAFRGSRSGTLRLAQSFASTAGNPDWVTDMKLSHRNIPEVAHGEFCKGFALATKRYLPTLLACLEKIHVDENERPPHTIYVTGHSLGGALAAGFCSAIVLGTEYGPNGVELANNKSPILTNAKTGLEVWPWATMDMTAFAAPGVGDRVFKLMFDSLVSGRNIRLGKDIVATNVTSFGAGSDLKFLTKKGPMTSHEPSVIRDKLVSWLKRRLKTTTPKVADVAFPYRQNWDKRPWVVHKTLFDALDALYGKGTTIANLLPPDLAKGLTDYIYFYRNILGKQVFVAEIVTSTGAHADQNFRELGDKLTKSPPIHLGRAREYFNIVAENKIMKEDPDLAHFFRAWLYLIALQSGATFSADRTDKNRQRAEQWVKDGTWVL